MFLHLKVVLHCNDTEHVTLWVFFVQYRSVILDEYLGKKLTLDVKKKLKLYPDIVVFFLKKSSAWDCDKNFIIIRNCALNICFKSIWLFRR